MKRKILIINHSLQQGGVVRSLAAALNVIDLNKYDITLYVHRDQPELVSLLPDEIKLIVNHDTNHYYRLPRAFMLQAKKRLFTLLKRKKRVADTTDALNKYIYNKKVRHPYLDYFRNSSFDVVISYCVDICTDIALTIPAARHYVFFHSSKADFHKDITYRCFPEYDRIVAVSPAVENVLIEGFPTLREKIICLTNFVDGTTLKQLSRQYPADYPVDSRLRICSCGRLDPEKGFDLAAGAAKVLKNSGCDFVWYFVGDGSDRKRIEQIIAEYGLQEQITITGFLINPYPYIADCDIYVQPSNEESYGLSIREAQILGKAIISTETVGGKTVLENGKKGLLVSQSAEAIAEGILKFIREPALKASFENAYTPEDNFREKKEYAEKWDALLCE